MTTNPERSHTISFQSIPAPAGSEGIKTVVRLVSRAFQYYPLANKLDGVALGDRLIFSTDRIHSTNQEDRLKKEKKDKSEEESITYRLLKGCGIPEDSLRSSMYLTLRGALSYYNPFAPIPVLYLDPKYFEGFYLPRPSDQISAGVELAMVLINANLDLVPRPRLLTWQYHKRISDLMQIDLESSFLKQVKEVFAVDTEGEEFIFSKELIKSLISYQGVDYQPQFMIRGERIELVLPKQPLEDAEYTLGKRFHSENLAYLATPVVDRFLDYFCSHYGIAVQSHQGMLSRYRSEEEKVKLKQTERIHGLMGFGSMISSFRAHADSSLIVSLLRSRDPGLNPQEILI